MNENENMSGSSIELTRTDDPEHEIVGAVLSYYADGGGAVFIQAIAREHGMSEDTGRLTIQLAMEDVSRLRDWLNDILEATPVVEVPLFTGTQAALDALTIRPAVSS